MKKTKMAAATTAAKTEPTQLTPAPAGAEVWEQYTGATGFEQVGQEDLGIPFLVICQKGSPEVDKTHKDYAAKKIEDIEVGDIFNNLSREIVWADGDDPLVFVPCGYVRKYMEWKPREAGGGLVRAHNDTAILDEVVKRDENNRDVLRNGNYLVTTAYFFGSILREDGSAQQVVIGMASTQLKKARFWLNLMSGIKLGPNRITPPMFSHKYAISTQPESNNKGSWFGWKIEVLEMITDHALIKDFAQAALRINNDQQKLLKAPEPEDHGTESVL